MSAVPGRDAGFWRARPLAVIAVAICGCSSPQNPRSAGSFPPTTSARERGKVNLTATEFRLDDDQGRPLSMSPDGVLTGQRGFWGRFTPDGTVTFPDGSVRGRLMEDGRVLDAKDVELARIASDGSAKVGDREVHFDKDGRLVGGNPEIPMRLAPPDASVHRAAMLILILSQLRHTPGQ